VFVSGCATCHNHTSAVGKSVDHMLTQRDCVLCHSYPDWSRISFKHVSAAYPGEHRSALGCTTCHKSNAEQIPYATPASAGTCAGCHTKDFKADAHPKTAKGERYSAAELANCSGSCHIYADSTRAKISKSLPGPRHRVSDASFKH
jgi:hypothetical protein